MLTIIISALLAIFVISVIVRYIKNKRNGKCSCGGDCSQCHSSCANK